jgi:hypothetical protein
MTSQQNEPEERREIEQKRRSGGDIKIQFHLASRKSGAWAGVFLPG